MKQKLRFGNSYAHTHQLAAFINRLATSKITYKQKERPSGHHRPRTGLGSASELDANSEPTRSQLDAVECERGALKYASNWYQVQSELPSQPGESSGIGQDVLLRWLPVKRNPEEPCVCTHAKARARFGLGLALGMAVLLLMSLGNNDFSQDSFSVNGKVISATGGQPSLSSPTAEARKACEILVAESNKIR